MDEGRGVGGVERERGRRMQTSQKYAKNRIPSVALKKKPFHRHILFGTEINLKTSEHLKGTMRNIQWDYWHYCIQKKCLVKILKINNVCFHARATTISQCIRSRSTSRVRAKLHLHIATESQSADLHWI